MMTDVGESKQGIDRRESLWAVWAVAAAFGTYFCMYGFRKPFTAAGFEGDRLWGVDFKTVIVSTHVLGYMLSKFLGIKVISEMPPGRRAGAILVLIALAEAALVLFGAVPRPWNAACLFLNGLALGMVFGLVLGFLEGRRLTEALTAGLCASFILADGVMKSVGKGLLDLGVSEEWMPATAGLIFLIPLCTSVAMLARVPAPGRRDIEARTARHTLNRRERWTLYRRYAVGISLVVLMYLLLTVMRSVRSDFAPELWAGLGEPAEPMTFSSSEILVALGVLVVNGLAVCVRDNRLAFFVSLATCCVGFALIAVTLLGRQATGMGAFPFMVLVGLGMYLPYVAVHTTIFERMLAMTRARGNLGFLMYVADAFGYLGYVVVMVTRNLWTGDASFLQFFLWICWLATGLSLLCLLWAWRYFVVRSAEPAAKPAAEAVA
jgi:hypothetical protein